MKEHTRTVYLELAVLATIGLDCDGDEELRSIKFADITNGLGIDLSRYHRLEKGKLFTLLDDMLDIMPEAIMAAYREQNTIDR